MISQLANTLIKDVHFNAEMNTTSAYYPIVMYLWAKISGAQNILEVGVAEGWGAFYLATAAKENGGKYYGIDNHPGSIAETGKKLLAFDLPHYLHFADTKEMNSIDFMDRIDLAFLDGEHTTAAVLHEIELIYPLMNKRGYGFIFIHDVVDMGNADAWWKLTQDPRFEPLCIVHNYGLGILRCIEGAESYESLAGRFGVLK